MVLSLHLLEPVLEVAELTGSAIIALFYFYSLKTTTVRHLPVPSGAKYVDSPRNGDEGESAPKGRISPDPSVWTWGIPRSTSVS